MINTNIDVALTVQNRLYGILENGVHRDIAYTLRTKTPVLYKSKILKIWSKTSASKYVRTDSVCPGLAPSKDVQAGVSLSSELQT